MVVVANQRVLSLPAASGCHASARKDADQLPELCAPPFNYKTPL